LTDEQMTRVADWLETGPDPEVDGVIRWRQVDLAAKIKREFGVTLAERGMTEVLRRLGYRRLSVRPQHPAQDAEAVEAHKKTSPIWSRPPSRRQPATSR
jgi:transposase